MSGHEFDSGAGLSKRGEARREEILADLIARAPGVRRRRRLRRSAMSAAIGAAPMVAVALVLVFGERGRPIGHGPEASATSATSAPQGALSESHRAEPLPTAVSARGVIVGIVSTASRSFDAQIASASGDRFEFIDDEALLLLLEQEGKREGLVRVAGKAMLSSEVASESEKKGTPGRPQGMGEGPTGSHGAA